jgi:hypothetical protein
MARDLTAAPDASRDSSGPRSSEGSAASTRPGFQLRGFRRGYQRAPVAGAAVWVLGVLLLLSPGFLGTGRGSTSRSADESLATPLANAQMVPAPAAPAQVRAAACLLEAAAGTDSCAWSGRTSLPPPVNASGENWVEFNRSGLPVAFLSGLGLAYDAKDNYTVLFGACPTGSASPCNETWVFRQGNWSQLHPLKSPPSVFEVAMAYDPQTQSVVMFGGGSPTTRVINQTWEFSAGNWTELNISGSPPPASGASMAYDAAEGYLLMFGGSGATGLSPANGTWVFENSTWTNLTVGVEPPGATSMTYDPILRGVVVYGGGNFGGNSTWLFRNGSWENVTPIHSPPAQSDASLSYDPLSQAAILFGGLGSGNQTWAFNGTAWVRLHPPNAPSSRAGASITYDAGDGLTLLAGGGDSESWAFGAGKVAFHSIPGPDGSTRMGASLHANDTTAWLPFNSYSLRPVPNPGYSGRGLNVSGNLVLFNGSYLLFGNATVQSDFLAFPTVTLESLPSGCDIDFNGTQYANGSTPYFSAPGAFLLSAPPCGTVVFGAWSVRGNASVANATNSTTRVTLTGRATIVAQFLANLEFYADPAGAGAILLNGSRVPLATPALFPVGSYPIQALAAPGWRLASLTTSGNGLGVGNGSLSVENSGGVRATFAAHPTVVIESTDPACGPVAFESIPALNGSLVGTDLGSFPLAAPNCADAVFEGWRTSGGVNVSGLTQSNTTVTVTGNGTLEAVLARAAWVMVRVVPSAEAGHVAWNGSPFYNGTDARQLVGSFPVQAVAAQGWSFVGWQTSGGVAEGSSVAVLSSNGTLVAQFENLSNGTRTGSGGGAWSGTILGLTVGEWVGIVAGVVAAVVIIVVVIGRRNRRNPAGAPTGDAELGGAVDVDERASREEEPG